MDSVTTNSNFDRLEDQVLKMLLEGDDPTLDVLRTQLANARRQPRELSGVGFFRHFELTAPSPTLPNSASIWFGDVSADIEGLQHGAGFVLFVDKGMISMLEGYTYGEEWPTQIARFSVQYLTGDTRDLTSLRDTTGWPRNSS